MTLLQLRYISEVAKQPDEVHRRPRRPAGRRRDLQRRGVPPGVPPGDSDAPGRGHCALHGVSGVQGHENSGRSDAAVQRERAENRPVAGRQPEN